MFCPSCEKLMPDASKYCGRCGMFLNSSSEKLVHLSADFAWVWRRSWAGFASGFIGWIIVFIISRMVSQDIGSNLNNVFSGVLCGVFLGTVGGIIEESSYKAVLGGLLGLAGGALGGFVNIPVTEMLSAIPSLQPVSIMFTWAVAGAFIGTGSGIIERSAKKILAGMACGFAGGAAGGFLGSVFYGSIIANFNLTSWVASRIAEGLSGGIMGALLWFFIGSVEKLYIFRRKEDPKLEKKICDHCEANNPLWFWYCGKCGHVLQFAAPRQKIVTTPFRGMERVINALNFLSWLFGVTGVIATPVIFAVFLFKDVFLAFISAIFSVLFSYMMVVAFRFLGDLLSSLQKLAKPEAKV